MEFSISSKAKRLVISLVAVGTLLTILGLFTSKGDVTERFLSNFLINGFFFFGISLGALFFLSLSYATESGWYVNVKKMDKVLW